MGCALEKEGYAKRAEECFLLAAAGKEEPAGMMYYNDQPADMILYQGLAQKKLGNKGEANARFFDF